MTNTATPMPRNRAELEAIIARARAEGAQAAAGAARAAPQFGLDPTEYAQLIARNLRVTADNLNS